MACIEVWVSGHRRRDLGTGQYVGEPVLTGSTWALVLWGSEDEIVLEEETYWFPEATAHVVVTR